MRNADTHKTRLRKTRSVPYKSATKDLEIGEGGGGYMVRWFRSHHQRRNICSNRPGTITFHYAPATPRPFWTRSQIVARCLSRGCTTSRHPHSWRHTAHSRMEKTSRKTPPNWLDKIHENSGLSLPEVLQLAQDRLTWRAVVTADLAICARSWWRRWWWWWWGCFLTHLPRGTATGYRPSDSWIRMREIPPFNHYV